VKQAHSNLKASHFWME